MTDQTVTLAAKLPDGNNDGVIDVSAAGAIKYGVPSAGQWILQPSLPAYTYWKKGYVPAPDPDPVPPPAPALLTLLPNNEAAARIGDTVFGFNAYGGLGTRADAPAEFRSPGDKFARKAFYVDGVDVIMPGNPVDALTFAYTLNGKRVIVANQGLGLGLNGATGTWAADGTWTGQMGILRVTRAYELTERGIKQTITVTSSEPVTDLIAMITQDPDNGDTGAQGVTTNKIISRDLVEAKLASGKTYWLSGMTAAVSPNIVSGGYIFNKPDLVKPQAVGYSSKADSDIILRGAYGSLAAGVPVSLVVEAGVR